MAHPFHAFVLIVLACLLASPISCSRRSSSSKRHHEPHHHHNEEYEQEEDTSFQNEIAEEDEDKHLALLHTRQVSEATKCEVPKLQVIHVSDHYPGKYYMPHCTLLHRCGKHAGCCAVESLKCVAAEKEKVTLYFYSVKFDGSELTERKVEKLVFTNHTRCGCAPVGHHPHHHRS